MATMEERSLGTGADHAPPLEGPHGERRRRAQDMLAAQDAYLERLEATLAEQLQQLASEVAQSVALAEAANAGRGDADAIAAMRAQYEALKQQFTALEAESQSLRQELEQTQVARAKSEQELRVRDALLKDMQASDEQRRVDLATLREQLADLQAQLTAARNRMQSLDKEAEEQREQLEARLEETKAQRRRIAREFKQQRAEHLAELDERKAELERLGTTRNTQLETELAQLKAKLAEAESRYAAEFANPSQAVGGVDPAEVRELTRQVELLETKLAAAEAKLSERPATDGGDSRKRDDLQRRFEMAVEEVRELKRANADLENKLKQRGGSSSPAPVVGGGGLNWEAQKQKLLASLEADSDDDDEEAREERASIEGTIQITDRVVAQKDREIEDLRAQLEQLTGRGGANSAAINELLDGDEIIRQEREKLVALQQEWRQKIGEAEIEISVQRAKLARERAELDEKIRQLQLDQDSRPAGATGEDTVEMAKPARGKWLARLGLKDIDDQGKKP
jgi:chromosome segregation ATPase